MENLPAAVFSVWGEQLEDCPPLSFFPHFQAPEDKRGHKRSRDRKKKSKKTKKDKDEAAKREEDLLDAPLPALGATTQEDDSIAQTKEEATHEKEADISASEPLSLANVILDIEARSRGGAGAACPNDNAIPDTASQLPSAAEHVSSHARPSFLTETEWGIVPEALRGSPAFLAVVFHRDPSQVVGEAGDPHQ